MEKHLTRGKEYDEYRKLELDPPEKKTRTKNDELETPGQLHENHRVRTLIEKSEETSHE